MAIASKPWYPICIGCIQLHDVLLWFHDKSPKRNEHINGLACKEAQHGNFTLKQGVHHMDNKFLSAVESPVMEVCYDILQILITRTSFQKEFIMTCRSDEWVFTAKDKETQQQLHYNSEDVKLCGSIDKYAKNSKTVEGWCLADFCYKNWH